MFANYNWADAFDNFMKSLHVMGYGMLGIFVVMCIIMLSVFILAKVTGKNEKKDKK